VVVVLDPLDFVVDMKTLEGEEGDIDVGVF
jgi:hypothetical protein